MDGTIRSRIAPTPSGYLHLGNAFNFLFTEALTRQASGSLRLRIDDLDAPRIRVEFLEDIFESLQWLGIRVDAGPENVQDHMAEFPQRFRIPAYHELLNELVATGRVFACSCSRKEVALQNATGQYSGTCRDKKLPLDAPFVSWRFRTEPADLVTWKDAILGPQSIALFAYGRDFIIRRRDGLPANHVASLADDAIYDINLVVRGEDLLYNTAVQLHLAKVLGLTSFLHCEFYHHPLLTNITGEKLSKSAGSDSLKALRAAGHPALELRRQCRKWYGDFPGGPV